MNRLRARKTHFEAAWRDLVGEPAVRHQWAFIQLAGMSIFTVALGFVLFFPLYFLTGNHLAQTFGFSCDALGGILLALLPWQSFKAKREAARFHGLPDRAGWKLNLNSPWQFQVSLAAQKDRYSLDAGAASDKDQPSRTPQAAKKSWNNLLDEVSMAHLRRARWFIGGAIAFMVAGCFVTLMLALSRANGVWIPWICGGALYVILWALGIVEQNCLRGSVVRHYDLDPKRSGIDVRSRRLFEVSLQNSLMRREKAQ